MQFLLKLIFINHMNSIFCQLYQIKTVYNPYNSFFLQKSPIADVSQGSRYASMKQKSVLRCCLIGTVLIALKVTCPEKKPFRDLQKN